MLYCRVIVSFGTEGAIGGCLVRFKIFRPQQNFVYSKLAQDEGDDLDDVNFVPTHTPVSKQIHPGGFSLEDSDEDEDMLFAK